jgi:hypothetical protein
MQKAGEMVGGLIEEEGDKEINKAGALCKPVISNWSAA